ncbi:uncharacterized protein TRIREDRAFT_120915 [Trichoderma reesei QM6a]|uniref:Predicted protein n=1 Tax=Hypocrea jecorina (strain QM6a) TaxID=431241 RepID=G0RFC8_HYPJQ|nr:uncharacterized protein TRIREDRAFT_120915 [Trichoderma reesei QM6a]EGR50116.1 predicted protein [Trichoderma reesei QM6a]
MSQKVNAKNLSYNSSLPPFLAALRAQAAGATGPDPILAAQRRGAKKRSGSEEAEDAPLVVDEHGNALEDLKAEEESKDDGKLDAAKKSEAEPARASIGGRKRKVGKVVGEEAHDGAAESAATGKKSETSRKETDDAEQTSNRKPKKKAKKIKLSFDEDEG